MRLRIILMAGAAITSAIVGAVVHAQLSDTQTASGAINAAPAQIATLTPTATPTLTPTPTSVRPPPVPEIDKTVNGQQGPITVTQGNSVTYRWVVTSAGDRGFIATVHDDIHDTLDGECLFFGTAPTCEQSAVVILLTPGPITNTSSVLACAIPPWPDHCQAGFAADSVTVFVVTPTPTPVPPTPIGGIGIFPQVPGDGVAPTVIAGVTAAIASLGGAAWYVRRRRVP